MTRLAPVGRTLRVLRAWLPHGSTLPEAHWRVRHRAVTCLLVVHAVVIGVWAVVATKSVGDILMSVGVPALGAFAASRGSLSRSARSGIAATSVMLTSA